MVSPRGRMRNRKYCGGPGQYAELQLGRVTLYMTVFTEASLSGWDEGAAAKMNQGTVPIQTMQAASLLQCTWEMDFYNAPFKSA